jgi:hemerythrin-like domain-containing protein
MSLRLTDLSSRQPAPAVPPLEELECTHQAMMRTLAQMAELLRRLPEEGPVDALRRMAGEIRCFIDDEARDHHAQEDRVVFPSLLASGDDALVALVRRLQQDHGWLEENWIELGPQLDALAHDHHWVDPDVLAPMIEVYTALLSDHIGLEESMIYPEARRRQVSEQLSAITRQAHWLND